MSFTSGMTSLESYVLTLWFHSILEIYGREEKNFNSLLQENQKVGWRGQNSERADTSVLFPYLSLDAKLQANHFRSLIFSSHIFFCLLITLGNAAPDTIKNRGLGGSAIIGSYDGSMSAVFQLCHIFQSYLSFGSNSLVYLQVLSDQKCPPQ